MAALLPPRGPVSDKCSSLFSVSCFPHTGRGNITHADAKRPSFPHIPIHVAHIRLLCRVMWTGIQLIVTFSNFKNRKKREKRTENNNKIKRNKMKDYVLKMHWKRHLCFYGQVWLSTQTFAWTSQFTPITPVHQKRHTQRQSKWEKHHWRYFMRRRPHSFPMIRCLLLFVVGRNPWERSHWSLGHNALKGPCSPKHTHPSALALL